MWNPRRASARPAASHTNGTMSQHFLNLIRTGDTAKIAEDVEAIPAWQVAGMRKAYRH